MIETLVARAKREVGSEIDADHSNEFSGSVGATIGSQEGPPNLFGDARAVAPLASSSGETQDHILFEASIMALHEILDDKLSKDRDFLVNLITKKRVADSIGYTHTSHNRSPNFYGVNNRVTAPTSNTVSFAPFGPGQYSQPHGAGSTQADESFANNNHVNHANDMVSPNSVLTNNTSTMLPPLRLSTVVNGTNNACQQHGNTNQIGGQHFAAIKSPLSTIRGSSPRMVPSMSGADQDIIWNIPEVHVSNGITPNDSSEKTITVPAKLLNEVLQRQKQLKQNVDKLQREKEDVEEKKALIGVDPASNVLHKSSNNNNGVAMSSTTTRSTPRKDLGSPKTKSRRTAVQKSTNAVAGREGDHRESAAGLNLCGASSSSIFGIAGTSNTNAQANTTNSSPRLNQLISSLQCPPSGMGSPNINLVQSMSDSICPHQNTATNSNDSSGQDAAVRSSNGLPFFGSYASNLGYRVSANSSEDINNTQPQEGTEVSFVQQNHQAKPFRTIVKNKQNSTMNLNPTELYYHDGPSNIKNCLSGHDSINIVRTDTDSTLPNVKHTVTMGADDAAEKTSTDPDVSSMDPDVDDCQYRKAFSPRGVIEKESVVFFQNPPGINK